MKRLFPEVREAIAKLIEPASLRWISWSHFEPDECGALNTCATMHGSAFRGDGAQALIDLAGVMREVLGTQGSEEKT